MDEPGILGLLASADVGQIALVDAEGMPYVIPVCFVYEDGRIFFHCGQTGKKLDCLMSNSAVCFSAFEVLGWGVKAEAPCNSWTYYRSIVANGTARIIEGREQKIRALRLLSEKYAKGPVGEMPEDSLGRTCVVEIVIDEVSGNKNEKKI
jgi:nitroimidazol reductase NimA-like FMN-containing flavoprotein (pyridoxamine 5'-phosphate oxidase superfamily)